MNISRGKIPSAQKVILYAPEGWGKSTAASKMPDPIFIDTEGSTKMLDVARLDADFRDWQTILNGVDYVISESPGACETLVIDTLDWAEQACINTLNAKYDTDNILTLDYGKGSQIVYGEFAKLTKKLDKLIDKGVNVFVLAHAVMRKQELPDEMGAFDRWELKLQSKQVKAQMKEWADVVLFGNYETILVTDSKTKSKKAQGGKRVIYTEHTPTLDAKNRHGMPAKMDLDYEEIKKYIFGSGEKTVKNAVKTEKTAINDTKTAKNDKKVAEKAEKKPEKETLTETKEQNEAVKKWTEGLEGIPDELKKLMIDNNVSEWEIQGAVASLKNAPYDSNTPIKDYDPAFIQDMLINKWSGLYKKILKIRDTNEIPFNS